MPDNLPQLISSIVAAVIALLTFFVRVKKKKQRPVKDLRSHYFFSEIHRMRLYISRYEFTKKPGKSDYYNTKKANHFRCYLNAKINWWDEVFKKIISNDLSYNGERILKSGANFAAWIYSDDGFKGRRTYLKEKGVSDVLIDKIEDFVTKNVSEQTHKQVQDIISNGVLRNEYDVMSEIMSIFIYGIDTDNKMTLRFCMEMNGISPGPRD